VFRKFGQIIGWLVILAFAICTVFVVRNYRLIAVHAGSMGNAYPYRSLVVVKKGDYHVGQAISFHTYSQETNAFAGDVTHRLIGYNADGTLITKGDANDTADLWITQPSDVIGGVVYGIPELGYWMYWARNSYHVGAIVCLLVIGLLGLSLFRDHRREKRARAEANTADEQSSGQSAPADV
jgi:signal peptidase